MKFLIISLFFLVVVVSGCIQQPTDKAITQQNQSIQVDSKFCKGQIVDPFCYGTDEFFRRIEKSHIIGDIKITADYPDKVTMGDVFDFKATFENSGNAKQDIVFTRFTPTIDLKSSDGKDLNKYKILSTSEFPGIIKNPSGFKQGYLKLVLNPGEKKIFSAKVKANYANIFPGASQDYLFVFGIEYLNGNFLGEQVSFRNTILFDQGQVCGNYNFPKQIKYCGNEALAEGCRDKYESSVCCNGVFYPGANCCSDSDCQSEKCIDGICIKKGEHATGLKPTMKAVGTKRIAIIELKDNANDNCDKKPATDLKEITDLIEGFYDQKTKETVGKDKDFLNFEWTRFGEFKIEILSDSDRMKKIQELNQANVSEEEISRIIGSYSNENDKLLGIQKRCGFEDFDQVVVIDKRNNQRFSGETENYFESAGHGYIYSRFLKEQSLSLTHEIGHAFGCRDLHTEAGGRLQWAGSLFGKRSTQQKEDFAKGIFDSIKMDVCRGELGWEDLNNNGAIDVLESSK